jgi:hypothetical protein
MAVVNATGSTLRLVEGAGRATGGGVVAEAEAAGTQAAVVGSATDADGAVALPHGFAMATPTNTTTARATSAETRPSFGFPLRTDPWNARPSLT